MDGTLIETNNNNNHVVVDDEAYEPTYAEAFPPLSQLEQSANSNHHHPLASNANVWKNKMAVRSSLVTQVFTIPMEERKYLNESVFGDKKIQAATVSDIMSKHEVSIEMSISKDQSLSVIVTGKADAVLKARKDLTQSLQQQCTVKMNVPKEHHRYIIGTKNKVREQLEMETGTRIRIPRTDEPSDVVEIVGTKEGVERARMNIQLKSDELSKLAVVRLQIPKMWHPFILGPNKQTAEKMVERTGRDVKLSIPPSMVQSDEIVISGDKEGVREVEATIRAMYEEMLQTYKVVSMEVKKSQHKYILGPRNANLQEILLETGVWVEVPHIDVPSDTIILRGEGPKLGYALTLVHQKAASIICKDLQVESWLHKFIIGPKGANISVINAEYQDVHIEFVDGEDKITLEGPPGNVAGAEKAIMEKVNDLRSRMAFVELDIPNQFHKHIIGKQGANVSRIRKETGLTIRIPSGEGTVVRIEGAPEHVSRIKNEILEMVKKMENEVTANILIDYNLHKLIIGSHGSKIKEVRDKFNQVQISFPDASRQSDQVTLRGQKNDVDLCLKHMKQVVADVSENNYREEVYIFKDFHRNIIGKGGAKIKKIREETETKIEMPKESIDSNVIVVTGKKANVQKAKKLIEQIQEEMSNISDITVDIPQKLHQGLIGTKGKVIKSISDDCGGVQIRFPGENAHSDKVHIKGPKDEVEKASKLLLELASEKQENSFTAEVRTKSVNHGFLIGRGGSAINKMKEQLGVRFSFASARDADPELITIIGKKEAVEKAKAELEAKIAGLENVIELDVAVDPKHHRHFTSRRGEVVNQISSECGGITVSFPKAGSNSSKVVLKGAKECVEVAKARVEEIVNDLESQITIEVEIPQKFHGTIMGAKGCRIQEITREHNVTIKLPERRNEQEEQQQQPEQQQQQDPVVNGNGLDHPVRPSASDLILVSGRAENCEAAKQAMLDLVPITEEFPVPHEYHGQIIGQKGAFIRQIQEDFCVNVVVPQQKEMRDCIQIVGPKKNLEAARQELERKVVQIEEEKHDRELRSFKLEVEVPNVYHNQIIGRKGASINKFRDQFDVNIKFPERGAVDELANVIVIQGYEKNAEAAKEALLQKVHELESLFVMEVDIDNRIHPRLIGTKGRAIHKIMEEFKVDIKFSPTPENPDLVVISGSEDRVLDCRDHLLTLEEEYIQDIEERSEYSRSAAKPTMESFFKNFKSESKQPQQKGFIVRDAPWCQQGGQSQQDNQEPITDSIEEFPSLGPSQGAGGTNHGFASAWGPTRRKN